ncbi:unnamed protein product [Cuscuta epithymum]|uniref:Uncharacterized protein n=1 Tax=Cuscuta epithymum TaxID=186058 RepID=A0AAV0F4W2_9ASTE|nr:unnamed protein product [Cuscuta epithymum]
MPAVVLLRESHLAALQGGDVDESGGAGGVAGGLVDGGGEGGPLVELVELLGAEVVGEDVEGEDVLDGGEGEVLVEERAHAGVVDGADGDGHAAVDLAGEVGHGEVVVEGGEIGVLGEDLSDVEGICGGGEEEDGEDE